MFSLFASRISSIVLIAICLASCTTSPIGNILTDLEGKGQEIGGLFSQTGGSLFSFFENIMPGNGQNNPANGPSANPFEHLNTIFEKFLPGTDGTQPKFNVSELMSTSDGNPLLPGIINPKNVVDDCRNDTDCGDGGICYQRQNGFGFVVDKFCGCERGLLWDPGNRQCVIDKSWCNSNLECTPREMCCNMAPCGRPTRMHCAPLYPGCPIRFC